MTSEYVTIDKHHHLRNLKKYLNYELSTSVLFFASFFSILFLFAALVAALIFTPYLLFVLYSEHKKLWIVIFFCIVIVPLLLFFAGALFIEFIAPLLLIPIGLFYFYCFLLRFEVNGWIRELDAKQQFLREKEIRDEELNQFMNQVR